MNEKTKRSYRDLVLYNAVVAAANAAAPQGQLVQVPPPLPIGGHQLAHLVHSPQGAAVLALPGLPVAYIAGRIRPEQMLTHRPSYTNGLLIQSPGFVQTPVCMRCAGDSAPFQSVVVYQDTLVGAVATASGLMLLLVVDSRQ